MIGQFTKEEAKSVQEAVEDMFQALSKPKQREYLGHLNEISLFISKAQREAPTEEEAEAKKD